MREGPFVDPKKERVFISLGIPMYNELIKGHLHETIENALAIGFDDIVILDDGSDDGSWEVLQDYADKYPLIRVYKTDLNSVFNKGKNRWKFIVDRMAEKSPDWIVIRAADQIYSHKATIEGGDLFRKKLTEFYRRGIEIVRIPLAHLWRSRTWYRADNIWGEALLTHSKSPIWRFHPNYSYNGRELTGTHRGWHHPSFWGFGKGRKLKGININGGKGIAEWDIVVLHLGHTTHHNKVLKFRWSMEAAKNNATNGRSATMPPPDKMPPVNRWLQYDGYKGFHEFKIVLKRANPSWFPEGTSLNEPEPELESFYELILEYNKIRAAEYLKLKQLPRRGKELELKERPRRANESEKRKWTKPKRS